VGPRSGMEVCGKCRPHRIFFIILCTLCVLHHYLVLHLDCPVFCFLSVLITQNTNIQASSGFEPAILTDDRPETYSLDHTAIGIGWDSNSGPLGAG
jgi:hypothetical protein